MENNDAMSKPFCCRGVAGFLVLTLCLLTLSVNAAAAARLDGPSADQVAGEILVKFKARVSAAVQNNVLAALGDRKAAVLDQTRSIYRVTLTAGQTIPSAVAAYQADPSVEYAQPNYIYRLLAVPDDALYGQQWGLKNDGQTLTSASYTVNNPGVPGMDIDAEAAWNYITDCSSVVVAILDTGVNYTHTDLAANMWDGGASHPHHGWDFKDNDNDPMPSDASGHGTHIAGIIGSVGRNAQGTTGLCWRAQLMALRAGDANGLTTATVVQSVDFALAHGANVINMSFGGHGFDQAFSDAISRARDSHVLIITAAGNEHQDIDLTPLYPCSFPQDNLVCVAALDQAYELASFSNYGAQTVDVGAPGTNIVSTWPGKTIMDSLSTGWTSTAGWARDACDFGSGAKDMLVDPPNWCAAGSYANNTDDRVYKQFDLSGLLGAGISYYAFVDTQAGSDFFDTGYRITGGDPFGGGVLVDQFSGSTLPNASLFEQDVSGCLTAACTIGFRLTSDSSGTGRGVGIFSFGVNTAQRNSSSYSTISGTSLATPYVTGLAAMIWAYNPGYTYLDVVNSIRNGGRSVMSLSSLTATGRAIDAMGSIRYINAPSGVSVLAQ
jgi:thermitase